MCGCDPFLYNVPAMERDIIVSAYAARVRTGVYGHGHQVQVQTVTDALSSISKTIELAGQQSPIYRAEGKYTLVLQRMVEGFRREDPPSIPQLAVPITVPNLCYNAGINSSCPFKEATGCLVIIAFFYLLRVGEYTPPRYVTRNGEKIRATRTIQFTIGNVGFFKNGHIVSRTSTLKQLLACDAATLKLTNQKNGRMGATIHQEALENNPDCPIQALEENLLCDVFKKGKLISVTSKHIIKMVRTSTKLLRLDKQAIDPDLVGAHSLRAGGAMALKLNGYDDTIIM
jgi:hypothetical protein